MFEHTMTLLELEDRIKQAREQGADDYTPVWISSPGYPWTQVQNVKVHMPPVKEGRRVVLLEGWFDRVLDNKRYK